MEYRLICADCGATFEEGAPGRELMRCASCEGVLNVRYSGGRPSPDVFRSRPKSLNSGVWRYADFLPESASMLTMGEGNTPIVRATNLERKLGLDTLFIKNEGQNPTGTYKDRGMAVAISVALDQGYERVTLGSAGNAGASAAAYSARAGLRCELLLPIDAVYERIRLAQLYGAHVTLIDSIIDDCINFSLELQREFGWMCVTTARPYNPYCGEGYKTLGYELAEQFSFKLPDWLVMPIGGGSLLSKTWQGLRDLQEMGLITRMPRLLGVQAEGCSPYVKHFVSGAPLEKWGQPNTIAIAIADIWPFDAPLVDQAMEESNGTVATVNDGEILAAMKLLAGEEGMLAEPASATVIAVIQNKVREGLIAPGESVACVISGSGIKDLALSTEDIPQLRAIASDWAGVRAAVGR